MLNEVKFDFEKQIYWSIHRIENFQKERAYRIIDNQFTINNSIVTISKENNEDFICKIFLDKIHNHTFNQNLKNFGIFEQIILDSTGHKYFIPGKSAIATTLSLSSPQVITLVLNNFQSGLIEDFNDKMHRLVIPVEKEPEFDIIDFSSLKIKDCITFCGLVQISIDGFNYHMFKYKNDDTGKKYLIIDGQEINSIQNFKIDCNSIITAFGYISGNLYLNEYYYLTFDNKNPEMIDNILYEKKEKSAITDHPLFEPFRFQQYLDALGKKEQFKNINYNMPSSVFSKLCHVIKINESYSRCCQLIIEGNQSKQLLLKAGIYSIALETLTNIIYEENKEKINPITDKKLVKLIQEKFRNIINEYDTFISKEGFKILESKINDINKPTNSKKLSVPFEIYKLKLKKEDIEILNQRNKFLHGSSPFSDEELKEKEDELKFIISRLHYMLNSLMLKYIGYSGHIINYPAWIQFRRNEKISDHLFRLI